MKKTLFLIFLLLSLGYSVQIYLTNYTSESGSNEIFPGNYIYLNVKIVNTDNIIYKNNKVELEINNPYFKKVWNLPYLYTFDYFYPGESKEFTFTLRVPSNTPPGKYEIEIHFSGDNGEKIKNYYQNFYIYVSKDNYFDINLSKNYETSEKGILSYNLIIRPHYISKDTILKIISSKIKIIGNDKYYIGDLNTNETRIVPIKFYVPSDLPTDTYPIQIEIDYKNYKDESKIFQKVIWIFVENENQHFFKIECEPTTIELGKNKINCKIKSLKNYNITEIILPNSVIGRNTLFNNTENFSCNIYNDKPGIFPFCVKIIFQKEDKKEYSETDCYNFYSDIPSFDIKVIPNKKELIKNEINKVYFTLISSKKLDDLKIQAIDGEVIGSKIINNKTTFSFDFYPITKNYVIFNVSWRYNGFKYSDIITIPFILKDKINKSQLFIYYNLKDKIIGVANRGKNKLYSCYLTIQEKNVTIFNKYIGDLDADDYDQTDVKNLKSGKYNVIVQCYDDMDNLVENTKKIEIKKEYQNTKNDNFMFIFLILIIIGIVFLIYKVIKKIIF